MPVCFLLICNSNAKPILEKSGDLQHKMMESKTNGLGCGHSKKIPLSQEIISDALDATTATLKVIDEARNKIVIINYLIQQNI